MKLVEVALVVMVLNLPFGYWRSTRRRASFQWMLAVHIPVPFVIALRIFSGLGWHWTTYPALVGAFALGQFSGGIIHRFIFSRFPNQCSACLVWDVMRICSPKIIKK